MENKNAGIGELSQNTHDLNISESTDGYENQDDGNLAQGGILLNASLPDQCTSIINEQSSYELLKRCREQEEAIVMLKALLWDKLGTEQIVEQAKVEPAVIQMKTPGVSPPTVEVPGGWLSLVGGNPLGMLPNFNWDANDRGEAERFIRALNSMADEQKWSDFKKKSVLESKLGPRARAKYFEGLGNDDTIDIKTRVKEFLRLFSRKPKPDEGQDLFLKCIQARDESVISFKLRLIGLSETLKDRLKNNSEIYEEFLLNQFRRGLKPELRIEVLKDGKGKFDEVVDRAIEIEECMKICNSKSPGASIAGADENQVKSLGKQVQELANLVKRLGESSQVGTNDVSCKSCGYKGHNEQQCRNRNVFTSQTRVCDYCHKRGHYSQTCYSNPANAANQTASNSHTSDQLN